MYRAYVRIVRQTVLDNFRNIVDSKVQRNLRTWSRKCPFSFTASRNARANIGGPTLWRVTSAAKRQCLPVRLGLNHRRGVVVSSGVHVQDGYRADWRHQAICRHSQGGAALCCLFIPSRNLHIPIISRSFLTFSFFSRPLSSFLSFLAPQAVIFIHMPSFVFFAKLASSPLPYIRRVK